MGKKPFTAYKFRTMKVDTDEAAHRDYVRSVMDASAAVGANGVYKLDRERCDHSLRSVASQNEPR